MELLLLSCRLKKVQVLQWCLERRLLTLRGALGRTELIVNSWNVFTFQPLKLIVLTILFAVVV